MKCCKYLDFQLCGWSQLCKNLKWLPQARCQLPFPQPGGEMGCGSSSADCGPGKMKSVCWASLPLSEALVCLLESLQEDWLCLLWWHRGSSWFKILRCSSGTWLRQQKSAGEKLSCFQLPAKIQASRDWLSLVVDCQWWVQNVLTILSPAMDKFIQSESHWPLIWAELPETEPTLSADCLHL